MSVHTIFRSPERCESPEASTFSEIDYHCPLLASRHSVAYPTAELGGKPGMDVVGDGDDALKVVKFVFVAAFQEVVLADKIEVDDQLPTHPVDDAAHLHDGDAEQTGYLARSHPDVVARQLKAFVLKHDEVSLHHSRALHLIYITMPMLGENCLIFASFVASVSISQPNFSCVIFAYT